MIFVWLFYNFAYFISLIFIDLFRFSNPVINLFILKW